VCAFTAVCIDAWCVDYTSNQEWEQLCALTIESVNWGYADVTDKGD